MREQILWQRKIRPGITCCKHDGWCRNRKRLAGKGGLEDWDHGTDGSVFYYAHLDSYAELEKGDPVKAGDLLGYMGDSGYGEEGTTGEFPVHLHLGIYLKEGTEEISVNPYPVLRYAENARIKCVYSR